MENRFLALVLSLFLLFPTIGLALSLDQAKQQGLVGETTSGYLEAVSSNPSKEVVSLVAEINRRRKAEYQQIATKNGTDLSAVEKLAAKKAFDKTAPGNYIKRPNGQWVKK